MEPNNRIAEHLRPKDHEDLYFQETDVAMSKDVGPPIGDRERDRLRLYILDELPIESRRIVAELILTFPCWSEAFRRVQEDIRKAQRASAARQPIRLVSRQAAMHGTCNSTKILDERSALKVQEPREPPAE
jgi:hypothetical protein